MEGKKGRQFQNCIFFLSGKMKLTKNYVDDFIEDYVSGVGVEGAPIDEDDVPKMMFTCSESFTILFFTDRGRIFSKKASEIDGENIFVGSLFNVPAEDRIVTAVPVDPADFESESNYLVFSTKRGMIKKTKLSEFARVNVNGKVAINVREGDELRVVAKADEECVICLSSSSGNLVKFPAAAEIMRPDAEEASSNFSHSGRTAAGKCGIKLEDDEEVVSISTTLDGDRVLSIGENGIGKTSRLADFRETMVGKKSGVIAQKINAKTGKLVASLLVGEMDEVLLITNLNRVYRFKVVGLHPQPRNSSGVSLMKMEDEERIIYFTKNYA